MYIQYIFVSRKNLLFYILHPINILYITKNSEGCSKLYQLLRSLAFTENKIFEVYNSPRSSMTIPNCIHLNMLFGVKGIKLLFVLNSRSKWSVIGKVESFTFAPCYKIVYHLNRRLVLTDSIEHP